MSDELAHRIRSLLLRQPTGVYLNSAAEGLPLASAQGAYDRYLTAKSRGSLGRAVFDEIEAEAREAFAGALGVAAADVAFVASTSRGLDAVVKSIEWAAGDSIVLPSTEFPSAQFAAELLAASGVEVRTVEAGPDGAVDAAGIAAAIDATTRLVVVSVVSFRTGQHLPTDAIVAAAHAQGALVFLDAVQALGAVPFGVGDADFACAASFKWLQGVHGAAGLYVSPRARGILRAPYVGYRSVADLFPHPVSEFELHADARRYQEGLPDYGALAVLVAVLAELQPLRAEIVEHDRALTTALRDGLLELGAAVLAPAADRGSIVAFETPRFAEVAGELERLGTVVWARDGRVRLAPHGYTTSEDVSTALAQLAQIGVH